MGGAIQEKTLGDGEVYQPCMAVYHSCTYVSINGSTPRDLYQCDPPPDSAQGWPYGLSNGFVPAVYDNKADVGVWEDDWTLAIPDAGKEWVTPLGPCANQYDGVEFSR